jgi:F0F1-type ATP synthase membrane subunit b/b'
MYSKPDRVKERPAALRKSSGAEIRAATAEFESALERVQVRAGAALAKDLRQFIVELQSHAKATAAELSQPSPARTLALAGRQWLLAFVAGFTTGLLLHWLW